MIDQLMTNIRERQVCCFGPNLGIFILQEMKMTEYPFKVVVAVQNYNARLSSIYNNTSSLFDVPIQPYLIIAVIRKFCSKQVFR